VEGAQIRDLEPEIRPL